MLVSNEQLKDLLGSSNSPKFRLPKPSHPECPLISSINYQSFELYINLG